jgi:nucleoside-diphosphate-sugar epimerase
MTGTLLSLGHGYCATALARHLVPLGWRVIGTHRRPEDAAALRAQGVVPMAWPDPGGLGPALADATHLLCSIAPGPSGDPALAAFADEIAQARHLAWVGYLSSTAVYGDHAGGWVDEDTPPAPGSARGKARLQAEDAWHAVCARAGVPCHIFRLSGIYGPGRAPFDRLRSGAARRIVKPGQVFSRIHVDDIVQVLVASMAAPFPQGALWNLADDEPAPPQDVTAHAARLLGLPPPPEEPFDPATLSPMAASFYSESRKVGNARVKRDLGLRLLHPDYRAGLQALHEAEQTG